MICLIQFVSVRNDTLPSQKVDRHFYNAKKAADDAVDGKSSLFLFEKKPEVTTDLALFTEENKTHILSLIKARRIKEGLDTKSNLPLFNKIRSEEFKKCTDEERAAWEDYARGWNEVALATWEESADEEVLLRYFSVSAHLNMC